MNTKKIDETIAALCERITAEAKGDTFETNMPATIIALARLIEARTVIVADS